MNTNDIRAMVLGWFKRDQAKQELTKLNPSQQRRFNRILKREMAVRERKANREEKVLEARRLRVEGKQAKQRESLLQQAKERQPKQESKTAPEFKSKQLELDFKKSEELKVQADQNQPQGPLGPNLRLVVGLGLCQVPGDNNVEVALCVHDYELDPTDYPESGNSDKISQMLEANLGTSGTFPTLEIWIKLGRIWCIRGTTDFNGSRTITFPAEL